MARIEPPRLDFLLVGLGPAPEIRITIIKTLTYVWLGGPHHPLIRALDVLANDPGTLAAQK